MCFVIFFYCSFHLCKLTETVDRFLNLILQNKQDLASLLRDILLFLLVVI